MPYSQRPPRNLPEIYGVPPRAYEPLGVHAAADSKAAAALTPELTSLAVLRRVYAPVAPSQPTHKPSPWRGRSPLPPTALARREDDVAHTKTHHLAPLVARGAAQVRYEADVARFLAACEEGQRTAIKFDEQRQRTRLLRRDFPAAPSAPLCLVDAPALIGDAAAEWGSDAESEATQQPAGLRVERERAAGAMVDEVLQASRREGQPQAPIPSLVATCEQPPTLHAEEERSPTGHPASSEATVVRASAIDPAELRRLRLELSASLVDSSWEAAVEQPGRRRRSREDSVPRFRAVCAEAPRPPARQSGKTASAGETPHATDGLRAARMAEAVSLVADAMQSSECPPSVARVARLEAAHEEAPTRPPAEQPHSAQRDDAAARDAEAAEEEQSLRAARRAEAVRWVRDLGEAAPHRAPPTEQCAEEEQHPPVTLPPTVAGGDASAASLRTARRREAAGWVSAALASAPPQRAVSVAPLHSAAESGAEVPAQDKDCGPLRTTPEGERPPLQQRVGREDGAGSVVGSGLCPAERQRDSRAASAVQQASPLRSFEEEHTPPTAVVSEAPRAVSSKRAEPSSALERARRELALEWVRAALAYSCQRPVVASVGLHTPDDRKSKGQLSSPRAEKAVAASAERCSAASQGDSEESNVPVAAPHAGSSDDGVGAVEPASEIQRPRLPSIISTLASSSAVRNGLGSARRAVALAIVQDACGARASAVLTRTSEVTLREMRYCEARRLVRSVM